MQPSADVVHVKPPGDDVAVYDETGEPFPFAADHASVALPLPATALVRVGAVGTAAGVAESAFDAAPVPIAFVAVTVKVKVVPFVKPVTVQASVPVVQVKPPGDDVAVYDVTADPLPFAAVQTSATLVLPRVALVSVGALGSPAGIADSAFEAGPVPFALVAVTVKV